MLTVSFKSNQTLNAAQNSCTYMLLFWPVIVHVGTGFNTIPLKQPFTFAVRFCHVGVSVLELGMLFLS